MEDAWRAALRPFRAVVVPKRASAEAAARRHGSRVWAFDVPSAGGGAPKCFAAASVDDVGDALLSLPTPERCLYEVLAEDACAFFFDLECAADGAAALEQADARAAAVAAAAVSQLRAVSPEAIAATRVLALDASRDGKFSRHLLLVGVGVSGALVLAQTPRAAGDFALAVRAQLPPAVASMIDAGVYAAHRCFRTALSSKLGGAAPPLVPRPERCDPPPPVDARALFRASLVHPAVDDGTAVTVVPHPAAAPAPPPPPPPPLPAPPPPPPPAPAAAAAPAAPAVPASHGWATSLTSMPLLDMPRLRRHRTAARRKGAAASAPHLLGPLLRWASAELTRRGCVGGAREWRYERAAQPRELLVHFDGRGGVCDHIGRPHRRNNIMVTVDVLNGVAWQRCWDDECRRGRPGAHVKARSLLAAPPTSAVPCAEALRAAIE